MPITWSQISARLGLPRPDYGDTPIDLVDLFNQRDAIIDFLANIDSGPIGSRPPSSAGSPGKKRRFYLTEGEADSPRLDIDFGTGWVTIGPDPANSSYFEVACTGPSGLVVPHGVGLSGVLLIPFNTEILDTNNRFNNTAGHYSYAAPSSGVYYFSSRITLQYAMTGGTSRFDPSQSSMGMQGAIGIQVNGADKVVAYSQIGAPGSLFTWEVSGTFFCTAGDLVTAYAANQGANDLNVQGGLPLTRFSGARIS